MEYVKEYFDKFAAGLKKIDPKKVDEIVNILFNAWKNGDQVFIVGNGGSASTASHMACDLGKGTLQNHYDASIKRLRVISLTDNVATMTAIGNDLGYDHIYSQQLRNLLRHGDVVIVISASGNSPNIVNATEVANSMGATTIGFLGFDGGKLKGMVDHPIVFEEKHYGRVEDFHLLLNHLIAERLSTLMRKE